MILLNPALQTLDLAEPQAAEPQSLLELARAGDAEAYGEVYHAYATRLLRHAMTLCGNPTLAEELAQDTLVEAWKHLPGYNGRCKFFTWLSAILLNRYRNTVRRNRLLSLLPFTARQQGGFPSDATDAFADESMPPDKAAEVNDQTAVLRQCVAALPAKYQQVIYLRFYVDDSLEGVAAALGCSLGTVKSRLYHALERLRRMNALKGTI